jgi:hypothetical protein
VQQKKVNVNAAPILSSTMVLKLMMESLMCPTTILHKRLVSADTLSAKTQYLEIPCQKTAIKNTAFVKRHLKKLSMRPRFLGALLQVITAIAKLEARSCMEHTIQKIPENILAKFYRKKIQLNGNQESVTPNASQLSPGTIVATARNQVSPIFLIALM